MKLLIVDDSLFIRHFIKTSLSHVKIETIIEAEDGYEAIEMYLTHKPDLVLLDINMPNMNGIDALRAIRAYDNKAKVIMISSMHTSKLIEECKALGASAYMQKPIQRLQLEDIITACNG